MVQPCFNLAHGDVSETGKIVAKQLDENIKEGKLSDRLAMPCIVRISHIAATFDGPRHTDERPVLRPLSMFPRCSLPTHRPFFRLRPPRTQHFSQRMSQLPVPRQFAECWPRDYQQISA